MSTTYLTSLVPQRLLDCLEGTLLDEGHFTRLIAADEDVYDPYGRLVLSLRRRAVAFETWHDAAGAVERCAARLDPGRGRKHAVAGQPNFRSGTVGFMRCTLTARARRAPDDWQALRWLVDEMAGVFRRTHPHEYAAHLADVGGVPDGCRIGGTPFTTVACNRTDTRAGLTARMGCHRDGGNIRGAYGLLSVHGSFTGGLLVFPKYRLAVDLRSRDLLIADNTELHGNTAITGRRLSVVAFAHDTNVAP